MNMSYITDPREENYVPKEDVIVNGDNVYNMTHQWGAMLIDLCEMTTDEYMRPMTVIVAGSTPNINNYAQSTKSVNILFSVLKDGEVVSNEDITTFSAPTVFGDGEPEETQTVKHVWTARWDWIGSFEGESIKVAATIKTTHGNYTVCANLTDNDNKFHEESIFETEDNEAVTEYESFGVGSVDEETTNLTSKTYTNINEETRVKYVYKISTDPATVALTFKRLVDGAVKQTAKLRFGEEIPAFEFEAAEGYNFLGWFDEEGNEFTATTMPSKNLTIMAKIEPIVFNVAFNVEGETILEYTIGYGKVPTRIPYPTKSGMRFSGWEPNVTDKVYADTVFMGSFSPITYTVTWSGYTEGPIVDEYTVGEEIITPSDPEKEGYTFCGWTGTRYATMPAKNLIYKANFKINTYKANFIAEYEDGTRATLASVPYTFGKPIAGRVVPAENGYTYSEWSNFVSGMTMPASDVDFVTTRTPNTYKLSYYVIKDEDGVQTKQHIKDVVYPYNATVSHFDYSITGWNVSGWENEPSVMPCGDVEVCCCANINQYFVTFRDGDNIVATVSVPYGTPIASIIPEIEGCEYIADDLSFELVPAHNVDVNGHISYNEYKVKVTVNGETNEIMVPFNTDIEGFVNENYPAEEGYTLSFTSNVEGKVPANNNTEVVVIYTPNELVLSYHLANIPNGDDIEDSVSVHFNDSILPILPSTEYEGRTFDGWKFENGELVNAADRMPNRNVSINGTLETVMLSVSLKNGEEVVYEGEVEYGTSFNDILGMTEVEDYINATSANGITLVFNADSVIKSNLTVEAIQVPNKYTLTFRNEGEVIGSQDVDFGSTITYPVIYNYFSGETEYKFVWENESYNGRPMPAESLIIEGHFEEVVESTTVYFGSLLKDEFTEDQFANFGSIEAADAKAENGAIIDVVIPKDEVYAANAKRAEEDEEYSEEFEEWEESYLAEMLYTACILVPKKVDESTIMTVTLKATGVQCPFVKKDESIEIEGVEYHIYTYGTQYMRAGSDNQTFTYRITLR